MSYAGETTEKTFTVTFDSNGGSAVDQQTVPNGGMAAPPAKPTKSGEGFVRWCSDVTLDTEYDFDTPVTSDITLYAQWSEIIYTVIFNGNDGSPIEDELVGEGGKVTQPADPILNGYVFDGWYLESAEFTTPYDFETPVIDNITLCAKWNDAVFDNITDLGKYLSKWSANDADNPYIVSLNVGDISTLRATLNDNAGKYVYLDLSDSTIETIPDNTFYGTNPYGCAMLTGITIPDGVKTIGNYAFRSCVNLASVTIGSGVETIGQSAFSSCTNLASVTIGNNVTSIGNSAFASCTNLASIAIPDNVETIGSNAFLKCTDLTSVTIGSNVKTIRENAFASCTNLASIAIPDSVETIEISAFSSCANLASVTIGNNVTSIGSYAFENCKLASITIPNSVKTIGSNAFRSCVNLASVTIGSGVETIWSSAFYGCRILTEINVSDDNTNYTAKDGVLYNKAETTLVVYPTATGTFIIQDGVTRIEDFAFAGRSGLTSITIPDGVKTIGGSAFVGCSGLTSITIPNSVTNIGQMAFQGCSGLTSITIPDNVTRIERMAFQGCYGLTSITIPAKVSSIEEKAFHLCSNLTSVTFAGNNTSSLSEVFPEGTNGSSGYNLMNAYNAASPKAGTYTRAEGGTTWTKQ
jgi:uncharacterized repeat protein (TIGR02543 family)